MLFAGAHLFVALSGDESDESDFETGEHGSDSAKGAHESGYGTGKYGYGLYGGTAE